MFKLSEIASVLRGRLIGPDCDNIGQVTTDSRQARPGQLFFALKGPNFDGHDFAIEAFSKTKIGVVVEREIENIGRQIVVADTLKALGLLANYYREKFAPLVIAITGTNGKTTTKNIIGQIMAKKDKTLMTEGTMNNQVGLPLTLLRLNPDIRYCVLEIGTNRPGEIENLCKIAEPTVGVLTNIGYGHLAGFASRNELVKEKLSLINSLPPDGPAVINAKIKGVWTSKRVVTFSLRKNAHYYPRRVTIGEDGSSFSIGKNHYQTNLLSRVNIENIVCAIATTTELGIEYNLQRKAIGEIMPEPMRMAPIKIGSYLIINDCYNANPNSMKEALLFISRLKRRKIAVLGDMLELGKASARFHKRVGEYCHKRIDLLIAIGDQARFYQGISFNDRSQAVDYIRQILKPGDAILFKASRAVKMEEIAEPVISYLKRQGENQCSTI